MGATQTKTQIKQKHKKQSKSLQLLGVMDKFGGRKNKEKNMQEKLRSITYTECQDVDSYSYFSISENFIEADFDYDYEEDSQEQFQKNSQKHLKQAAQVQETEENKAKRQKKFQDFYKLFTYKPQIYKVYREQQVEYVTDKAYGQDTYTGYIIQNSHINHGHGTYLYQSGDKYEGEWYQDKKEGKGVYLYNVPPWKGDVYMGTWLQGKRHGQGVYFYSNGNVYEGEFFNNLFNGNGTFT